MLFREVGLEGGALIVAGTLLSVAWFLLLGALCASAARRVAVKRPTAPPEPPAYSWEEYLRDVYDDKVTIQEIFERCEAAGGIPRRPRSGTEARS